MKSRKIGIMGGTFNPIHCGHLMLAEWAMDFATLDEVWVIPTGYSYKKQATEVVSAVHRYEMCLLATAGNPRMKVLDLEMRRGGYTYSYETFEQLSVQFPEDHFYFIFGADCLFSLETWKYPERIFAKCDGIAAIRNDSMWEEMEQKAKELEERFHAGILLMPFVRMELSSTQIRNRVAEGRSIRYLVPDAVNSYILEKRLYRDENNRDEKDT